MLVQTINAITRRFQNVRGPQDQRSAGQPRDRSAAAAQQPVLGLHPGRAAQAERHASELRVRPSLRPAPGRQGGANRVRRTRRSKFLEAFHNLLHLCAVFFKQDDDTTVIADGFPVLNALKEVHLILSQGAHNQFGDLPSTARIEMLMQQWLLARPEMREFLPTRIMVAYPEPWMDRVDTMKKLQGWTDTSVLTSAISACSASRSCCRSATVVERRQRAAAGHQLGAVLAAGDPGLHPRLPRGHRRRPHGRERRRQCRRNVAVGPAAASGWRRRRGELRPGDARFHLCPLSRAAASERISPSLGCAHARAAGRAGASRPTPRRSPASIASCRASEAATPAAVDAASVLGSVPACSMTAGSAILCDAGLYPIARWGVERASSLGMPVRTFTAS